MRCYFYGTSMWHIKVDYGVRERDAYTRTHNSKKKEEKYMYIHVRISCGWVLISEHTFNCIYGLWNQFGKSFQKQLTFYPLLAGLNETKTIVAYFHCHFHFHFYFHFKFMHEEIKEKSFHSLMRREIRISMNAFAKANT